MNTRKRKPNILNGTEAPDPDHLKTPSALPPLRCHLDKPPDLSFLSCKRRWPPHRVHVSIHEDRTTGHRTWRRVAGARELSELHWARSFSRHHETLLSFTVQARWSTRVSVGPENSLGQCCCQTAGSQRTGPKCMRFWATSRGTLLINNSPLSDTLTFHAAVKLSPFMLITRENHLSKQLVYKLLIYAAHTPYSKANASVEFISIKYKILTEILSPDFYWVGQKTIWRESGHMLKFIQFSSSPPPPHHIW